MGSTFSKRVRKFGPTDHRKGKIWSESDVRKGKLAFPIAKFIAEGLGRLWTHSRPLKQPSKIPNPLFWGLGGSTGGSPLWVPVGPPWAPRCGALYELPIYGPQAAASNYRHPGPRRVWDGGLPGLAIRICPRYGTFIW